MQQHAAMDSDRPLQQCLSDLLEMLKGFLKVEQTATVTVSLGAGKLDGEQGGADEELVVSSTDISLL
jgi:hypothetical protein